jgi:uncharacterized protein YndB with AHSA1/START domain
MGTYEFVTTWRIEAPRHDVWAALRDGEDYARWWPGMERVEVIDPGAEDGTGVHLRFTTRSRLPYKLLFETVSVEAEEPDLIVVAAVGELDGTGRWDVRQDGAVTTAVYTWRVATTKPWMNLVEPFARPLFVWNHHVLMGWGAQGLARRLGARLLGEENEPGVSVGDVLPSVGLLGGSLAAWLLIRRRSAR